VFTAGPNSNIYLAKQPTEFLHSTVLLKKLTVLSQAGIPMPYMVHECMLTKDHWPSHEPDKISNILLLTLFYHTCVKFLRMFFPFGIVYAFFTSQRTAQKLWGLCNSRLAVYTNRKIQNFNNQNILTWPVEQDCQWTASPVGEQSHYIAVIHRRRRSEGVFCSLVWVHFVSPIQGHNPGAQP